jgi:hypothetical protein
MEQSFGEYEDMGPSESLRHLSKKYIRKPECRAMLEKVARIIDRQEHALLSLLVLAGGMA